MVRSRRLDGLGHDAFQRRVSGTCAAGEAIRAVGATGGVTCQSTSGAALADVQDLDGLTCETPSGSGTTEVSIGNLLPDGNGFYRYPVSVVCEKPWPLDGTQCDDGDPWTTDDLYTNGQCAGTPPTCDDGSPYTNDAYAGEGVCAYVPADFDGDGDGYSAQQPQDGSPDCNDENEQINPAAPEVLNGLDDNCNGTADEGVTP